MKYEALGGESIGHACKKALELAELHGKTVVFEFNGSEVTAEPGGDAAEMERGFMHAMEASRKAYKESPEGIEWDRLRQESVQNKQCIIDGLLSQFLKDKSLDDMMLWLNKFTLNADDIGVKIDALGVFSRMEGAGYKENEGVGQKPEWFKNRDRMGRYIMGQAMNCLRSGMPPHPITLSFIEKYFALEVTA